MFGKPLDLGPIIGQLDFHDSLHLKSAQTMSWPFNRANLFVNALFVYVFHSLSIRENTNIFCGSKVLACPGIGNPRTHNEVTFAQTNAFFLQTNALSKCRLLAGHWNWFQALCHQLNMFVLDRAESKMSQWAKNNLLLIWRCRVT